MFISRGRGRGHAVPDIAIAHEVVKLHPQARIAFVSYADGASVFRAHEIPFIDLGAPENPELFEMVFCLSRLFLARQPQLVIAHEEFGAVLAARIAAVPCIFLTDFFFDPNLPLMQLLKHTLEVVFTGERGVFTEPPYLKRQIEYVGRAVRPFEYNLSDRARARAELKIDPSALVALVQPGGWTESRVAIAELLLSAWQSIPEEPKAMLWLAGRDHDALLAKLTDDSSVILLREDWQIDRLMVASDLLITKANRLTVYEAASLGLPSISISTGANWPDDVGVGAVESNIAIVLETLTSSTLADIIRRTATIKPQPEKSSSQGVSGAANRIVTHILKLAVQSCPSALHKDVASSARKG
jgi:UDP-N-acetylglucosamine:LPS N-acetylglucosamine transferase